MKIGWLIRTTVLCFALTFSLHAQVPQMINYQGRVLVGSTNYDGAGQFKFALVNATGTLTYWSNDGTSTAGSQPTNAVSLTLTKGLYSVLLGDTTIANMTVAIPLSVFNNADVRLRVWFNDGTHGSQLLAPDQRVAANGYAMMASTVSDGAITSAKIANAAVGSSQIASGAVGATQIASGSVGATQITNSSITAAKIANAQVVKTLNGLTDAVTLAAGSNVSITPSGNTLTLASSGGAFSLNGANAYYNGGNVGIGTNSPASKLHIISGATDLPPRLQSSGTTSFAAGLDLYLGSTGKGYIGVPDTSAGFAPGEMLVFGAADTPLSLWANQNRVLTIGTNGNVGIGTSTPQKKLDVADGSGGGGNGGNIHVGGYGANGDAKLIHFGDLQGSGLGYVYIGENGADDIMELRAGNFYFNNGNVGIGTNATSKKLEVAGDTQITGQLGVNHVLSGITMLVKEIPNDIFTFAVESSTGSTVLTVESSPVILNLYGNANKPGGGTWGNTSDQRIKKNIQPLAGALDKLAQLHGVSFDWANPEDHSNQTTRQAGFLAQQVEAVFPDWVTEISAAAHDKALTPDGKVKTIYLPFEFDALVVEALRELRAEKDERIAALERQNADLQKRLEKLERRMDQQEAVSR